jgi:hypothetical protein
MMFAVVKSGRDVQLAGEEETGRQFQKLLESKGR